MPPSHRQKQSAQNNVALATLEEKFNVTSLQIKEKFEKIANISKELRLMWSGVNMDTNFHKHMGLWYACAAFQKNCDVVADSENEEKALAAIASKLEEVRHTIGLHINGQRAKLDALRAFEEMLKDVAQQVSSALEKLVAFQAHVEKNVLHYVRGHIALSRDQQVAFSGETENAKPIPIGYWDHIISALDPKSSGSTTERVSSLIKAIEVDPYCHIAWRIALKFDELNSDYTRRYTRMGPEAYMTYYGRKLSMIDVSARILEIAPLDFNIWMWVGAHLLFQDGSRGGCMLARKILGKYPEPQAQYPPTHGTVCVAGRQYNGMECVYQAVTLDSSGDWARFLPILRHTISAEFNIKAPKKYAVATVNPLADTHDNNSTSDHQEEDYFGVGYCLAQIKPSSILGWLKVWMEFPTTQEVVYIEGESYTSYDCLERLIETNFEDTYLWLLIQHYLSLNEGLHSKDRNGPRKNNSIIFKGKLEITAQYCVIRVLEIQPSPANWGLLLETMNTDDVVCVNGKEYTLIEVLEASDVVQHDCTIHTEHEHQRYYKCWECAYLQTIASPKEASSATEFWSSLVRHMYHRSASAMDSIVLDGTTFTLQQCVEKCLKHLPKDTQSWKILIKTMHHTNTTQAVINDVVFTRAQCISHYSSISGCRVPVGWIPTAEVMSDEDLLVIPSITACGKGTQSFSKKDCFMYGICDANPQGTLDDFAKAWRGLANCCVEGDVVVAPTGEQFTAEECSTLADAFESKVNFKCGHGYVANRDLVPNGVPTTTITTTTTIIDDDTDVVHSNRESTTTLPQLSRRHSSSTSPLDSSEGTCIMIDAEEEEKLPPQRYSINNMALDHAETDDILTSVQSAALGAVGAATTHTVTYNNNNNITSPFPHLIVERALRVLRVVEVVLIVVEHLHRNCS